MNTSLMSKGLMDKSIKRRILVVLLTGLLLLTVGCDAEMRAFVVDLALAWMAENAVDTAKYAVWGRSGNDEVDAVMEAKGVVDEIQEADQLMEEGREENDLGKMQQAVDKRPGDYTYRVSYGAALLKEGYSQDATSQFDAADDSVLNNYGGYHIQEYAIQGIEELSPLRADLEANGFENKQQCETLYGRLSFFYDLRYARTGEDYFEQQRERFAEQAGMCQ